MEEISLMIADTREEIFRARQSMSEQISSTSDYLQEEFLVRLLESRLDNLECTRGMKGLN